jgi:uncharacterized protein (DUF2141 family)
LFSVLPISCGVCERLPLIFSAVALVVLGAASAWAQPRDVRSAVGTGTIAGVVVTDDLDAQPVRKARVTLNGVDLPGATTITDEAGRFVFVNLPAGRYTIGASKPTWVTTQYGSKRPLRPGTAVPLADGQRLQIAVRMAHGAVITGLLLDHANLPASGAQVRALRYQMSAGERRLVEAGSATTDDRGAYRIYGLAAGDYYVSAFTRTLGGMMTGELHLTSDADVRDAASEDTRTPPSAPVSVALAPAFYPSGTSVSQAGLISLAPGEERGGVDFALPLVRTAPVEGSATLPEGGAPAGVEVSLIAAASGLPGQPSDNIRRSFPGADGQFQFAGIPPGTYNLIARGSRPISNPDGTPAPPLMVWGAAQITVDGEPVTGVSLSLEPGLTLAGRVRFPESALKPPDLTSVRIGLASADAQSPITFVPAAVPAGADGQFTLVGVMPGRYRVTATFPGVGRPGGWTIGSITANGGDALDAPLVVAPNQHVLDALVTFTDRLAQISGAVRAGSPADYTVVVFPEDQSLWQPQTRRIQGARAAADGAFTFRNVPSGAYLVALSDDVETGEWFDPVFLQRLRASATRVAVRGTDAVTVELTGGRQ